MESELLMRMLSIAIAIAVAALVAFLARSPVAAVEWEHGWKTDYVVATRYKNPVVGYNIGFIFPKQPYDSDRAETFDFLAANGCHVYQGGGSPGAPLYAVCKDVTDKETANKFLVDFLPKLDAHMRGLK